MKSKEKYAVLTEHIAEFVGGKDNIEFFTHCVTRLRFNLRKKELVDLEKIKDTEGVVGCQWSGEQLQIIIGQDVGDVYHMICEKYGFQREDGSHKETSKHKFSIGIVLDAIAGCLSPLIPLLIGAGMLKVLLLIGQMMNLIDTSGSTYTVLSFVSDAGYYFLPVFVGATAAQKFGCNMGIGMMMGAMLIHPTFLSLIADGNSMTLFKIPIYTASYTSTLFPTIMTVYIMSLVEKKISQMIPSVLKSMFVPLITIIIMAPLTLCLIGPAGAYIGIYFARGIMWLYNTTGFFGCAILASLIPFVVMTGMHAAFLPYMMESFATVGYEPVLCTTMFISNFNQGAAALAVSIKTKSKTMKSTAASSAVTSLFAGVTEPALFGVNMKLRKPLIAAMIGSLCGGGLAGALNVYVYSFAGSNGIFGLPIFLGDNYMNLVYMIISLLVGITVTFITTLIIYKEEITEEAKETNLNEILLTTPSKGRIILSKDIEDETFANEYIGPGFGIVPEVGELYSPVDGEICMVAETKHAIGVRSKTGEEILLHIGIDTVNMNGDGFELCVKEGQSVKSGQLLVNFDKEKIAKKNYSDTVVFVITKKDESYSLFVEQDKIVEKNEKAAMLIKE